jgi:hypothetical protein
MSRTKNSKNVAKNKPVAKTRTRNSVRQMTIADVALIASSAAAGATQAGVEAFAHSQGVVSIPTASTSTASKQAAAAKPAKKASTKGASTGNRPGRPVKADSYLQRAKTLYSKMVPAGTVADRKKVVTAFETKLGIPKKTANTYFHICHGPSKTPGKRGRKTGSVNATNGKSNGKSAAAPSIPAAPAPDGNVNISVSPSVAAGLEQAGLATAADAPATA